MIEVIHKFLKLQKVRISKAYLRELLTSHPEFPSLLSIADIFERLGLNLQASKIDRSALGEVGFPLLLPINSSDGKILLIENSNALARQSRNLDSWGGIVLKLHESNVKVSPANNVLITSEIITSFLKVGFIIGLMLLLIVLGISGNSLLFFSFIVIAVIGLFLSLSLTQMGLGKEFKVAEALCDNTPSNDCNAFITSDQFAFFGFIRPSDLAVIFFLSEIILGTLYTFQNTGTATVYLLVLGVLGVIGVFAAITSLGYQIAKNKWCRFCLLLDGFLLLQVTTLVFVFPVRYSTSFEITLTSLLLSCSIVALTGTSVLLIKKKFVTTREVQLAKEKLSRIAFKGSVFKSLLLKERSVDRRPFEQEITIGQTNVPVNVLMVTNLFCKPCKRKFRSLVALAESFPEKVSISIRLVFSNSNPEAVMYFLQYWLENIHDKPKESSNTIRMFNEWFLLMDFKKFSEKHKAREEHKGNEIGRIHYEWAVKNNIARTPTVFINGYELPPQYDIDDLEHVIAGLTEELENEQHSLHKYETLKEFV